ncbi:unnamed protein product [Caenorhabditis auriculariae]|uniref:Protein regulator of cytokinesis 1 n=1 Tax=Caenorhabditis auriculariae TaxID=2777116 RepID=A0A8S1HFD5_9PELO|nr:unnamed protein product [Caenorhabditis auriculariae]
MSRRLSVLETFDDVHAKIRTTFRELSALWDQVHMSESMRMQRIKNAVGHIMELCDSMNSSEMEMVEEVIRSIEDYRKKVENMREQLGKPPFHVDPAVPGQLHHLDATFERRENLLERLHTLSQRLDIEDVELVQEFDKLFSDDVQMKYEQYKADWEELLAERLEMFLKLQKEMNVWARSVGAIREVVNQDEELKALLESDPISEDFVLTQAVIDSLSSQHAELKHIFVEYNELMQFQWTEKYGELEDLWQKCHVNDFDRLFESEFNAERHSEGDFERMCAEKERLAVLYDHCKPVYGVLDRWKKAWDEKIEIENKRKDPSYFKNRAPGHSVLKDTRIEKDLNDKILPRLMNDLREAYDVYLQKYPNQKIFIESMEPMAYCKWQYELHDREKEIERLNKMEAKKQNLEATRVYSPVQRTPTTAKRHGNFRTPASCSRLEPVAKKLHFESALPLIHSPSTSSLVSIITPVRQAQGGPKHSSPKEDKQRLGARSVTPSSAAKRPLAKRNIHF